MYGYAYKCDVCGKVEFVDYECHKDYITPKDWISMRGSKYGVWHMQVSPTRDSFHFCNVDCAIKWLKEQKAEKWLTSR